MQVVWPGSTCSQLAAGMQFMHKYTGDFVTEIFTDSQHIGNQNDVSGLTLIPTTVKVEASSGGTTFSYTPTQPPTYTHSLTYPHTLTKSPSHPTPTMSPIHLHSVTHPNHVTHLPTHLEWRDRNLQTFGVLLHYR